MVNPNMNGTIRTTPQPPAANPPAPIPFAPSSLTETQLGVLSELAKGQSIALAARAAGVSRGTVFRWIKSDPDFQAAYHTWRALLIESARARVLTLAELAMNTVRDAIKKGHLPASLAVMKSLGILNPPRPGPIDPHTAAVRNDTRRLKLQRRLGEKHQIARWAADRFHPVQVQSQPKPPDEPAEEGPEEIEPGETPEE